MQYKLIEFHVALIFLHFSVQWMATTVIGNQFRTLYTVTASFINKFVNEISENLFCQAFERSTVVPKEIKLKIHLIHIL